MSFKLKALGLSLIAALALSVAGVLSASAETGGHFTSEVEHTTLEGEDVAGSNPILKDGSLEIECQNAKYTGTTTATTVTEVTVSAAYEGCKSKGIVSTVTVDMNGCDYLFTIRKTEPEKKDNTVHVLCPEGKVIELTVGTGCIITIKAQTPAGGVVYETGGTGKTHDITGNITVSGIHAVYHGGVLKCLFANGATRETSTLTGKSTLRGFNTAGEQVGITATGF